MKKLLLLFYLTFITLFTFGQGRNCPSVVDLSLMQTQNPARYQRFMNLESFTTNYINNQGGASYRLADPNGVIIIPVVVHVLHRNEAVGTGLNISHAQIQSQIDVLNEDFRRLNADRINTPAAFTGVASDYNFEFRLACQDPNGNSTNGVTRRFTSKTGFQFSSNDNGADENAIGIKMTSSGGEDPWPTDRYLNMWVGNFTDGTLGYATFPGDFATNPNVDGVVITTTSMGRTGNVLAPYDGGRTATHEVGHWLNLFHVWGDANCGDDLVADTPQQQTANFGCPAFPHRTCGNTTNGDMFMNYMDYTDDGCMNVFTNAQRLRGRAIFAAGGPRATFLDNYFRIQQPTSTISCSGIVKLTNPNCLATTWAVVSEPATLSSASNSQTTISSNGIGTVVLRATGGNYVSEISINVGNKTPSLAATYDDGGLVRFTLPNNPPYYYNSVYNLTTKKVDMVTSGAGSPGSWQRIAASPTNTSWSKSGNRLTFYFYQVGQTATFRFTASNGCGTVAQDYSFKSINYSGGGCNQFSVSPNPSKNVVSITAPLPNIPAPCATTTQSSTEQIEQADSNLSIQSIGLYDADGQLRRFKQFDNSTKSAEIDISDLRKGIYFLKISDGTYTESHRIIKE